MSALQRPITATDFQQRALEVKSSYQRDVQRVDADGSLSVQEKQRRKATAYLQAKRSVATLQAEEEQESDGRRRDLERRLFGMDGRATASDAISFRDAMDRAAQLESISGVQEAMDRALLTGDTHLAKAVLARGLQFGAGDVVKAYLREYPADRDFIEELRTAQEEPASAIIRAFAYNVDPPRGMTDAWARELAQASVM